MRSITRNTRLLPAAVFSALATTPLHSAIAQEQAWVLEEILVTAQRRVESLQRAPVSVSAFNAEMIRELGIVDVEGLTRFTPNVTIHKIPAGASNATVRIRGTANTEVIITTDPAVTLYIDGVLIGKAAGSMLDLIDLERIEVLRGPQGTLFGRNAVGGAISVHTREPADEFLFQQQFDVGNLELFESQTLVNVPIYEGEAGTLLGRAVYMYHERDGWAQNEAGDKWGIEDRHAGRFSLAWTKDDWSARYVYDQTKWRETIPAPYLEAVGVFTPGGGTPKADALALVFAAQAAEALANMGREETELSDFILNHRASTVPGEFIGDHELDVFGHALTLSRDSLELGIFGDVSFKSITAYREMENFSLAELDGTPLAITFFETGDQQIEQFTQEFQFVGTALDDRVDYIMGLYWFEEDGHLDSYNRTLDFTINGAAEPFNEIFTLVGIDNEAWAVYGQATLADEFTEGLSFTLGWRYTEETRGASVKKDEFRGPLGLQTANCDPAQADFDPDLCLSFDADSTEDFDNLSWMGNVAYQWTDDHMSYFRVATGYQSGGFNGRGTTLGGVTVPFEEQTSMNYEIGVKSKLWQQRISLNTAIFYTENDDLQIAGFPPGADSPNVGTIITNAGESHVYGLELELMALLTPELEAFFQYAFLEGEFDEYIIGQDDLDGDGVRETPVDVADDTEFSQSPEHAFAAGLRYTFGDVGFGNLWGRVDVSWQDDILFNGGAGVETVNAPELDSGDNKERSVNQQSAYTLVDAQLTLEQIPLGGQGNLSLTLWGRNLLDEDYRYTSVDLLEPLGFGIAHYGDPRTYGVTLNWQTN